MRGHLILTKYGYLATFETSFALVLKNLQVERDDVIT